jgi:hypothetical protein
MPRDVKVLDIDGLGIGNVNLRLIDAKKENLANDVCIGRDILVSLLEIIVSA